MLKKGEIKKIIDEHYQNGTDLDKEDFEMYDIGEFRRKVRDRILYYCDDFCDDIHAYDEEQRKNMMEAKWITNYKRRQYKLYRNIIDLVLEECTYNNMKIEPLLAHVKQWKKIIRSRGKLKTKKENYDCSRQNDKEV